MSNSYNNKLIGTTHRILVNGSDRKTGFLSGKTEGRIIVRFPSEDRRVVGEFIDVEVVSAAEMSVEGRIVER